jgi:hypothetical protein
MFQEVGWYVFFIFILPNPFFQWQRIFVLIWANPQDCYDVIERGYFIHGPPPVPALKYKKAIVIINGQQSVKF